MKEIFLGSLLNMETESEIRNFMSKNDLSEFDIYEYLFMNFHSLANRFASEDGEED